MIHLDISDLYSQITYELNTLTNSITTHSDFRDVCIRPITTKHSYRYTVTKNKNMNLFGTDDNYFYMDVFIENLVVDVLAKNMHWCGNVKSSLGRDYLLSYITESSLTIDQYNLLKNLMESDSFFDKTFARKAICFIEESIDNNFSLDEHNMTWEIISPSINANTLILESLGDWRIDEYMRLLNSGALNDLYEDDDRRCNIPDWAKMTVTIAKDSDELTKDELVEFNTRCEAIRSSAEDILTNPNSTNDIKHKYVMAGIFVVEYGSPLRLDYSGLSKFVKDNIIRERENQATDDSSEFANFAMQPPPAKVLDHSVVAEEIKSGFSQD